MWSQSVDVLNPWDALCAYKERYMDVNIDNPQQGKMTVRNRIANFLRMIADIID